MASDGVMRKWGADAPWVPPGAGYLDKAAAEAARAAPNVQACPAHHSLPRSNARSFITTQPPLQLSNQQLSEGRQSTPMKYSQKATGHRHVMKQRHPKGLRERQQEDSAEGASTARVESSSMGSGLQQPQSQPQQDQQPLPSSHTDLQQNPQPQTEKDVISKQDPQQDGATKTESSTHAMPSRHFPNRHHEPDASAAAEEEADGLPQAPTSEAQLHISGSARRSPVFAASPSDFPAEPAPAETQGQDWRELSPPPFQQQGSRHQQNATGGPALPKGGKIAHVQAKVNPLEAGINRMPRYEHGRKSQGPGARAIFCRGAPDSSNTSPRKPVHDVLHPGESSATSPRRHGKIILCPSPTHASRKKRVTWDFAGGGPSKLPSPGVGLTSTAGAAPSPTAAVSPFPTSGASVLLNPSRPGGVVEKGKGFQSGPHAAGVAGWDVQDVAQSNLDDSTLDSSNDYGFAQVSRVGHALNQAIQENQRSWFPICYCYSNIANLVGHASAHKFSEALVQQAMACCSE